MDFKVLAAIVVLIVGVVALPLITSIVKIILVAAAVAFAVRVLIKSTGEH